MRKSMGFGSQEFKDYFARLAKGSDEDSNTSHPTRSVSKDHIDAIAARLEREASLEVRTDVDSLGFPGDIAVRRVGSQRWIAVFVDSLARIVRNGEAFYVPQPMQLPEDTAEVGNLRVWYPEWQRDPEAVVLYILTAAAGAGAYEQTDPAGELPRIESTLATTRLAPGLAIKLLHEPAGDHESPEALGLEPESTHRQDRLNALPPGMRNRLKSLEASAMNPDGSSSAVTRMESFGPGGTRITGVSRRAEQIVTTVLRSVTFVPADNFARYPKTDLNRMDTNYKVKQDFGAQIQLAIAEEGPILADRLARGVLARYGMKVVRDARREQIITSIPQRMRSLAPNGDEIIWPTYADPSTYLLFRVPPAGQQRPIAEVPYHELRNAMIFAVMHAQELPREEALRTTMQTFGVKTFGAQVKERLGLVLDCAIREGLLTEDEGVVRVNPQAL